MTCNEAAPFISAFYDGERIPRAAAAHLHDCLDCRSRLADYLQMGVEVKQIANMTAPERVPAITWGKQLQNVSLWRLGREPMRVPRFALALMIVVIAALSAGLLLVRARQVTPWWFEFSIKMPEGGAITGVLSSSELEAKPRGFVQPMPDGNLAYVVRLVGSKEGSEEIGIRAQKFPSGLDSHSALEQVRSAPEKISWYVPGQKVAVPVEGYESFEITGQVLSEPPEHDVTREPFLPKNGELRLSSPVLLRNGRLVADMNGATTYASTGYVAAFYVPGEGVFLLSFDSFDGAVPATLENSQLTFNSQGRSYQLLTGTPIIGGEQYHRKVWVAHIRKTLKMGDHGKRESWAVWSMKTSEVPGFLQR
ncbi:MAG TPA: hypothetical protein VLY23_15905 [Candidatus Acidoferrum sp.]|nr:hypothetical protein [Candidatus Acidoferrum sp.]